MSFSVAQVDSVDFSESGRKTLWNIHLKELLSFIHPQLMFHSWKYVLSTIYQYLSIIHPIVFYQLSTGFIHKSIVARIFMDK